MLDFDQALREFLQEGAREQRAARYQERSSEGVLCCRFDAAWLRARRRQSQVLSDGPTCKMISGIRSLFVLHLSLKICTCGKANYEVMEPGALRS